MKNPDRILEDFMPFEDRLRAIYVEMDDGYDVVAKRYGFECRGCEESCCETRFYHHTWIEYLYLLAGFRLLEKNRQQQIIQRASIADEKHRMVEMNGRMVRVMCPLNEEGLCILYDFRPMICRLHGIAHELRKPGQKPVFGSGCDLFTEKYGKIPYISFDRTPFYQKMAVLEQEFRKASGIGNKIRMTIAKMLLTV